MSSTPVSFKSDVQKQYKKNFNKQKNGPTQKSNNVTQSKFSPCGFCGRRNHLERDCRFRQSNYRNGSRQNDVSFLNYATAKDGSFCAREEKKIDADNMWVLDSGSTSHMSYNKNLLTKTSKAHAVVHTSKKGQTMQAEILGQIKAAECTLNNVLYIPGLDRNLLSASAITQNGGKIEFENDQVIVTKDNDVILTGKKDNSGLYVVNINPLKKEAANLTVDNSVYEWHRKLGHLSLENMRRLTELSVGFGLGKGKLEACEVCQDAKQTRRPFKNSRARATRPLEIIHSDLVEVEIPTWDQRRYFVTFLDDFTHYSQVHLLSKKSDTSRAIKEYISAAESKWDLKVHKLRCDNGGEYVSTEFKNWCAGKGVIMDFTIPHTPQLNGSAERLNRSLMEKTRALLFCSGMDKQFWGEALYTATYLLNRSPTKALTDCTPAEKWFGKKPDLSMLQIFGSVAHAKVLTYTKKLDKRSNKCIFVGYAPNGYRLWCESKKKIIISRDVVFANEISPSSTNSLEISKNQVLTFNKSSTITYDSDSSSSDNDETTAETTDSDTDTAETSNSSTSAPSQEAAERLGRGHRMKRPPQYLLDYDLSQNPSSLLSYQEAITGDDKEKWMEAIKEEMTALEENMTWELVDKSAATTGKILTSRWIFKIKDDGRYKARLVVRGCQQREGIDYHEIFSPVVSTEALRTLIAYSAMKNFKFMTFDVKTAFLYGNIQENLYMKMPEGYDVDGKICKLKKALYGLKQAPAMWNQRLKEFLKKHGFIQLKTEQCVFVDSEKTMILAIHVDDGLLTGSNPNKMKKFLVQLSSEFKVTVHENLDTYLGIKFTNQNGKLKLSQESYALQVAETYKLQDAKPVSTPFAVGTKHDPDSNKQEVSFPFREAVGSLLYLSTKSRPDIALAVALSGRKVENPSQSDVVNVKRTIKYVQATRNFGISYPMKEVDVRLQGFCDADHAGDENTGKSTTGFIIYFNGGPVSWTSRRQPTVATNTCEAEYIAATEAAKSILFLQNFLEEITQTRIPAVLNLDNQSAINIVKNGVMNRRSKHMAVRYFFLKEKVDEGLLSLNYLQTEEQIADLLTKPLDRVKFEKHASKMVN